MAAPAHITIDFETQAIRPMPNYPPQPVGVSIKWPGQRSHYYAWGHPTQNNCTFAEAMEALERAWVSGLPLLFHHAKFDVAVAVYRLGLPMPPWWLIHDTMFQAYLCDPHARDLGLKELAEDWLQWPPEERDALKEWILANKLALCAAYPWNRKLNKEGRPVDNITPKETGAWIFATPGDLCGPYAEGDTERTSALFCHLWDVIDRNGLLASYDREREVMPILLENEMIGMRVDLERLGADGEAYDAAMLRAEDWLRRELRASGLNFDSDQDTASVLLERGIVPLANWTLTDKKQLSMSKETLLPEHFTGPNGGAIASVLGYRNRLKTCLEMFMRPWYDQASINRGYITTNWNQTRGGEGGTRTGRPSTNRHNFLNISKKWDGRDDGYVHPEFLGLPVLPLVRTYVLPDDGHVFLHRDFDGQELRVFAHIEQGDLFSKYLEDPALDPHAFVGAELMRVAGREIERTRIKTLNFQGLYGGGIPALQAKLRCSSLEAKELKNFHNQALPGRVVVNNVIKAMVRRGEPIRTWGGRLYFCEPPVHGRSKDYKLINYAIQGSAADLTKQALIDWKRLQPQARFMVTVYDEINISAHVDIAPREMALLKEAMERPRLTVPMLSSPKHGPNWGAAKKCPPEKGCPLCR